MNRFTGIMLRAGKHYQPPSLSSIGHSNVKGLRLVLLGAPGAGKGSYAKYIGHYFSVPVISTGDLLRKEIALNTPVGQEVHSITKQGGLVNDGIIFDLLKVRLAQDDVVNGYILDGFPRKLSQAQAFDALTQDKANGILPITTALNISLREDIIIRKALARRTCSKCNAGYNLEHVDEDGIYMPALLPRVDNVCDVCQSPLVKREDDTHDVVKTRLQVYANQAKPVEDYYNAQKKLFTWNVRRGLEDTPAVLQMLEDHLRKLHHTAEYHQLQQGYHKVVGQTC